MFCTSEGEVLFLKFCFTLAHMGMSGNVILSHNVNFFLAIDYSNFYFLFLKNIASVLALALIMDPPL